MLPKPQVRDKLDMKLHNRNTVWDLIHRLRPVSRAQLAKFTEMSHTGITRIVGELMDLGLLEEQTATHRNLGRKAAMLNVVRDAFLTLGIEIDLGFLQVCLVDLDNTPRAFLHRTLKGRALPPEKLVSVIGEMYQEMLSITGIARDRVAAAGIGIPGVIDRERGEVAVSRPLRWPRVPLRDIARAELGLPVTLENDVKSALYEEFTRHDACRLSNVAYLSIGSGVGSAVMCGGEILRGVNNVAGAIGHVIVNPAGERCDCGRRGCFSTLLAEKAVLDRIRSLTGHPAAGMEKLFRDHRLGKAWALDLGVELGRSIAFAVNHVLCSYDPQMIIAGGRLFSSLPELLDLALGHKDVIHDELRAGVSIIHSLSGGRDVVMGAALHARAEYLRKLLAENI